ncbi:MAG: LysR family transcriptional regulator [Lachnospiraceae bacterium]|nr:LysR family transcriptional regulator [Lachnospiraceae bacterium]
MDLHDMYYLIAIDRHGSIGKAADELHISQPALSKFVQQINRAYDEKIFVKSGHRLQTTDFGKLMINYANEFIALEKRMKEDLQTYSRTRPFRIGIPGATGRYLVRHAFTRFKMMHPEADLHYVQTHSTLAPELIRKGELDVAVCAMPEDHDDLAGRQNYREEMVLAVNKRNPIVSQAIAKAPFSHPWVDIRQMQDVTFILMDMNSWPRIAAEKIFRQCGFRPDKVTITTDIESAVQMASAGLGATILIDKYHLFLLDLSEMAILSCGTEPIYHESSIIWHRDARLPEWSDSLFDCIQEALKDLKDHYDSREY